MAFRPSVGQLLTIDQVAHRVAEHPAAPGMPYGQEGRQATVYQLAIGDEHRALKVFKPRYRFPGLVWVTEQMQEYARLPGLSVCSRTVLTPQRHGDLLRQYPDLTYAVLMPWVQGPTWMQVLIEARELTPEQSLSLARTLTSILAEMEQRMLAHCDLSGSNLMLPTLVGGQGIELVDVEQMYVRNLQEPALLPGGSPGYAHRSAPQGLWGATRTALRARWCWGRSWGGAMSRCGRHLGARAFSLHTRCSKTPRATMCCCQFSRSGGAGSWQGSLNERGRPRRSQTVQRLGSGWCHCRNLCRPERP